MTDRLARLLLECQGFAGKLEANHEMALFWMAEQLNGHPRAQDFEPTGHGGSDPTSQSGTRDDYAARDGKEYTRAIERAWRALDSAAAISRRYQNGVRPEKKKEPDGPLDEFCTMHAQFEVYKERDRGELCKPCVQRRSWLHTEGLGELTIEQVRHHADPINNGRWPKMTRDPKQPHMVTATPEKHSEHVARTDRLRLGTAYVGPDSPVAR